MMRYQPKTKAMKHQGAALEAAYRAPARPARDDVFAYLMDMGTGKSKVVLDEWGAGATLDGLPNLLVLAPAGSYRNWFAGKGELSKSELDVHLDPELRERMLVNHWSSGSGRAHRNSLAEFLRVRDRPRALFVNVEALSNVKQAQELVEEYLESGNCYMAIDESTTIKNPSSLRAKYITNVGKRAACRRILTGLLTPKGPLDAWSQFNFLDWRIIGSPTYFGFRKKFAITKKMIVDGEYDDMTGDLKEGTGRKVEIVVGYKNIDELQERINAYSFRVLKEECLDLEPKMYLTRDVEHTKEQARAYKELKENATTQIMRDSYVSVDMMLQMMIRLHQINLGYVMDDEGVIRDLPENRTQEIIDILDEHHGKTVIWTPFIHRIQTLEKKLGKEYGPKAVAKFYGGNRGTRHIDEARFIGDPECKIMIASQPAGGRGNTWICANLNIYDSNNYDLEQRQQSEDRTHRAGQTQKVTYIDLMTRDTVDFRFVHALRNKYDLATQVTGEKMRAWI
jgi:SNF2 family DNA or RNA helicase